MKTLKEWNEDIQLTKMDMMNWIQGSQGSWKANFIFLGLILILTAICYLLGWTLMFRVMGILFIIALFKILHGRIKIWIKKLNLKSGKN